MKIIKTTRNRIYLLTVIIMFFGLTISASAKTGSVVSTNISIPKIMVPQPNKLATTPKTIATVNGVAISETVYNDNVSASIANYKSQGIDVTDAEKLKKIKAMSMDNVIINEVIAQEIKKQKIVTSAIEIENKFQELVKEEGGPEKMKAKLIGLKMTEKKLRDNISSQLTNKKFFDKNVNSASVTVTSQEINTFYDQNIKGKKDAPVLNDASEKIKQYISEQKKIRLIQDYITKLKSSSKITILQ